MPKLFPIFVSVIAVLAATAVIAQTVEEPVAQRLPAFEAPSSLPPDLRFETLSPDSPTNIGGTPSPTIAGGTRETGSLIDLKGLTEATRVATLDDFMGYRYSSSMFEWIPEDSRNFDMFSIVSDHYIESGVQNGFGVGLGFHFLDGPVQTEMPPRLFDFSLAYQIRKQWGPFAFDIAASVLAASDFEGNARKGILFPGHAVGFLTVQPTLDLVFGVDYLDRGDIKLLPVAGVIWKPRADMRFELVFPRPRAVYQWDDEHRFYLSGELGGGTWAIERSDIGNDLATYSDLRVCLGVEFVEKEKIRSSFEVGYLFNRHLEYTSGVGDMHFDDAIVIRMVTRR